MPKIKKVTIILWVIAAVVLLASAALLIYALTPKGDLDKVEVCGKDYAWDDIYSKFEKKAFEADGVSYEGALLSDMVTDSGQAEPSSHDYKLTGSDGYSKTVTWTDMENGYLVVSEKKATFPDLTKSFWVRDLITIEAV